MKIEYEQLTNAKPGRVLMVAAVVALLIWISSKLHGEAVSASEIYLIMALIFGYALIDYLHAIRAHLATLAGRLAVDQEIAAVAQQEQADAR